MKTISSKNLGFLLLVLQSFAMHGIAGTYAAEDMPATLRAAMSGAVPPLEILTVTARRIEESAQDVPIALSVVSGAELSTAGLYRGPDLAERVPTLQIQVPNARLTTYSIRGLGSSSFNDGLESSVSMFVDGVYLGRQGMFLADLGDLQRVEILRGPQGTLFGKNSSAGALNILTRKPTQDVEAGIETTIGNAGLRHYRGHLSGPLFNETLAGRISLYDRRRDGRIENRLSGQDYNNEQRLGVRGQLLWTPRDDFSARLITEYDREEHDCCVFAVSHYSDISYASADFIGYRLPEANPFLRMVEHDTGSRSETRQRAITMELNFELPHANLTSITGWRDWDYAARMDLDGIGVAIVPYGSSQLQHRQLSQEIRLAATLSEKMRYVIGAYYIEQQMQRAAWLEYGKDATDWYAGAVPLIRTLGLTAAQIDDQILAGAQVYMPGEQQSDHRAVFGQLTWQLSPRLELSPGLRYTTETKTGISRRQLSNIPELPSDPFANLLASALRSEALGPAYHHRESIREHNLSGQFTLSYQFDDHRMAYIKWAHGYKSGGINAEPVSPGVSSRFDAEQANMLELGVKQSILNRRGWVNLALYQTDIEDYQALTYNNQSLRTHPQRDNLMNVGSVRARGIDLDSSLRWAGNMDLRFAMAWSDARYRDFDNAPCRPGSGQIWCDLGGKRLFNAPEWNITTGVDSHHLLTQAIEVYTGFDYQWQSGFYGTLERGEGSYQPARGIANWRLGLRGIEAGWDITVWMRNIFDKDHIAAVYALTGAGDYGAVPGDPRSYGLTLRINYK